MKNERSNGDVLTIEPWEEHRSSGRCQLLRDNIAEAGENTVETEKKEKKNMREGETNKDVNYTVGSGVRHLGEWGM